MYSNPNTDDENYNQIDPVERHNLNISIKIEGESRKTTLTTANGIDLKMREG